MPFPVGVVMCRNGRRRCGLIPSRPSANLINGSIHSIVSYSNMSDDLLLGDGSGWQEPAEEAPKFFFDGDHPLLYQRGTDTCFMIVAYEVM